MVFIVELNQIDPPGSPTPGAMHYAGAATGIDSLDSALAVARECLGEPVPDNLFGPCCDWQQPETVVCSAIIYQEVGGEVDFENVIASVSVE